MKRLMNGSVREVGEGIDAKNLMRLCSRLIQMELADPDPVLTALVLSGIPEWKI